MSNRRESLAFLMDCKWFIDCQEGEVSLIMAVGLLYVCNGVGGTEFVFINVYHDPITCFVLQSPTVVDQKLVFELLNS